MNISMEGSPAPVIILDRPAHPGNIGAAARAMHNTGLSKLRLVQPRLFPHPEATEFATGGSVILERARVFATLPEAVADLNFLVATTTRGRGQRHTVVTPRQLGERMAQIVARPETRVGIMFGTERSGLETVDVERANLICTIPTSAENSSLNLAQAVMVVGYELLMGRGGEQVITHDPFRERLASSDQHERLFRHMEEVLTGIDFIKEKRNRHIMGSLRAIFLRAGLDQREVAILRGIFQEVTSSRERAVAAARRAITAPAGGSGDDNPFQ